MDGIKVDISLTNSAKEDEQDGDVDVKVKIAPNTIDVPFFINWEVDASTSLTTAEESTVRRLVGGNNILLALEDAKLKDSAKYISMVKEIRVMMGLPVDAYFIGGTIQKDDKHIFFKDSLESTGIAEFGEIDIFADNTLIEVKSDWGARKDLNPKLKKQFIRYRNMKAGNPPIYLGGSQLTIKKTILQIEADTICAKILNVIKRDRSLDEVRLGSGTIIKIDNLDPIKSSKTKNRFVASEAEYNLL